MRILIVDDSPRMRLLLEAALAPLGRTVEAVYQCGDGESAIDCYNALHPDWVLMDIRLPGIDGMKATRRILTSDPGANVLIVTQHNEPSYREEAEAAGARGFVLKENLTSIPGFLRSGHGSILGGSAV